MHYGFIILAVLFMLFLIFRTRGRMRSMRSRTEEPGAVMERFAGLAVEIARRDFNRTLDFSPGSIQAVEEILGRLHEELAAAPDAVKLKKAGTVFGAYVGEVIRRANPGAAWHKDHPEVGPNAWPLDWGGGQSFPLVWCLKRVQNGPEDDIVAKYGVLTEQRNQESRPV